MPGKKCPKMRQGRGEGRERKWTQLTGQWWQRTLGSRHLLGSLGDAVKADPSLEGPDASPRRHRGINNVSGAKEGLERNLSGRKKRRRRLQEKGGRLRPGALSGCWPCALRACASAKAPGAHVGLRRGSLTCQIWNYILASGALQVAARSRAGRSPRGAKAPPRAQPHPPRRLRPL